MSSKQRKAVLSYPGVMQHAQQIARALHEANELEAYVTSFAFRERGTLARMLNALPGELPWRALRQLRRRAITEIPDEMVVTHPWQEVLRTMAVHSGVGPVQVDKLWDRMARGFDQLVASRHVPRAASIHAFEYTAHDSFTRAAEAGVCRVLHMPSLDSRHFEQIRKREREEWPQLRSPHDAYFEGVFAQRYARRCAEIELADLVVANSSLTRRSHIEAGADADKIVVVPLAGPEPIAQARDTDISRSLVVLWAGTFRLGKGAHYFLQAWRNLAAGQHAQVQIYGAVELPEGLLRDLPEGLSFEGSVPAGSLFSAFEQADVLVFPTLSDGFGMVVSEAFSRGLPVICSEQAGAADSIQAGRNGLIIPAGDARALTEALQWCLDNREHLRAMRHAALETARAYQWKDYRRRLSVKLAERAHGI